MSYEEFDSDVYASVPTTDIGKTLALAVSLKTALPAQASVGMLKACEAMMQEKSNALFAWGREARPGLSNRRPADLRADRAWRAGFLRTEACALLPVGEHPLARRAGELLELLFPRGLSFLKLPYAAQWAEGERIFEVIKVKNLEGELMEIWGGGYLEEITKAQRLYGDAIGVTKVSPQENPAVRAEALRRLKKAITRYVHAVLGEVEDDATAQLAREALRPIEDAREAMERRGEQGEEGDEPEIEIEEPTPAVVSTVPVQPVSLPTPLPAIAPAPVVIPVPVAPVPATAPAVNNGPS